MIIVQDLRKYLNNLPKEFDNCEIMIRDLNEDEYSIKDIIQFISAINPDTNCIILQQEE